jgi:DNA-binding NtrC family response regulator
VITEHTLAEGDEIAVGASRLVYLPAHAPMPLLITSAAPGTVTLEIPAAALLAAEQPQGAPSGAQGRARAHLGALALLGDALRGAPDAQAIGDAAAASLRAALGAGRALVFLRDATGSLVALGGAAEESKLHVGRDVLHKIVGDQKAVLLEPSGPSGLPAMAAPILNADRSRDAIGLVYVEAVVTASRGAAQPRGGAAAFAFREADLELVTCVAHLVGPSLDAIAARDALLRESRAFEERTGASREFLGESPAARRVVELALKVARSDSTVLLLGESGAGKELVASAIHRASRRARGPFVCVNCAALTESVLESELFGHEKGAFTGAVERRVGRFELADGGTLFLDEVGEISLANQAKFLRALEQRRFERVGGTRPVSVDVRVIAATNRDLDAMMRRGEFREDLFYRLSVVQIGVPPLRDRLEDVPLLAEHFLSKFRFQMGRRVRGFAPEALAALSRYPWPGNVRELRNAIEHAVVLGEGELLGLGDLPPHVVQPRAAREAPARPREEAAPPEAQPAPARAAAASLRDVERQAIVDALAATRGNKVRAASMLGIDRSTLYKKLKEYGIEGG